MVRLRQPVEPAPVLLCWVAGRCGGAGVAIVAFIVDSLQNELSAQLASLVCPVVAQGQAGVQRWGQ